MKKTKKMAAMMLTAVCTFSFSVMPVLAAEADGAQSMPQSVYEKDVQIVPTGAITRDKAGVTDKGMEARFVNDYRYRKVNVKNSTEWSAYKRISDNIVTGAAGASITATKEASFDTTVSGDISGLNISVGKSVKSAKGYTLNAGPNQRVYMGYRVKYNVEQGTRETYDITTGKVVKSNKYTVKVPAYGEYKLINY